MGMYRMGIKRKILNLLAVAIIVATSTSFSSKEEPQFFAATRVYFPSSSTADITPTKSGSWTTSSAAVFYGQTLISDFAGRTFTNIVSATSVTIDNSSSTASTMVGYFISPRLQAQAISGNINGQFRMSISSATGCTAITKLVVTVVDQFGNIVATLFNGVSGSTAITATTTNRFCPASAAISSFTCNTGDRLVFEIGIVRTAGVTSRTGTFSYGHTNTTDLPVDETDAAAHNPWVEFSNGIIWNHGITQNY